MRTQEGLNPYADALRDGVARGLKYKALTRLLKDRHSVTVSSFSLVAQWMQIEARTLAGPSLVSACADLEPYAVALRAGVARGLGAVALQGMLCREFGVTVSSVHPLRTWLLAELRKDAGTELVKSQEGLEVHAVALRAGLARGLGAEALRTMLLAEHGVTASSRKLLTTWMREERRREIES